MTTEKKLYIDSEGVKRGYYVYLPKNRTTGEVFYVGKGNGKRAWQADRRHNRWKEKVASLADQWEVELVKQDFSEIEAFELEGELVEQYGGCVADEGTLTNWIPRGEEPVSIRLGIQFNDGGWSAAYYDARKFKEFSRGEKETFVVCLNKELGTIISILRHLEEETKDRDSQKLCDSARDLACSIEGLRDASSDFLRRRISWKDFALTVEETLALELELEDIAIYHRKVRPLLKKGYKITEKALFVIDSGNRKEAEETATRMTTKR